MKSEEVTDDQLSVVVQMVRAGMTPFADFGVWRPFGQRMAKSLRFVSHFLDSTGQWRCKEVPGPDNYASWEACWRVFRTAAIMGDIASPAVLDRYAAKFRQRSERFSDCWHVCVLADQRCRSELWEQEHRKQGYLPRVEPGLVSICASKARTRQARGKSKARARQYKRKNKARPTQEQSKGQTKAKQE